jgi:hypothetical protein
VTRLNGLGGQRFAHLVVREGILHCRKRGDVNWLCECDCGGTKVASAHNLRRGDIVSCGCSRRQRMHYQVRAVKVCASSTTSGRAAATAIPGHARIAAGRSNHRDTRGGNDRNWPLAAVILDRLGTTVSKALQAKCGFRSWLIAVPKPLPSVQLRADHSASPSRQSAT